MQITGGISPGEVTQVNWSSFIAQQLAGLQIQAQASLVSRLTAAFELAIEEKLAELKDDARFDATQVERALDEEADRKVDGNDAEVNPDPEPDPERPMGVEDTTITFSEEMALKEEALQERVRETIDEFRAQLEHRASEIDLLRQDELNHLADGLLDDPQLAEQWQAALDELQRTAAEHHQLLESIARYIEQSRLQADASKLSEHIKFSEGLDVDTAKAQQDAIKQLNPNYPDSISELIEQLDEVEQELQVLKDEMERHSTYDTQDEIWKLEKEQRDLEFDVKVAIALTEYQVKEQMEAARQSVETDLELLPEAAQARKEAAIMLEMSRKKEDLSNHKVKKKPARVTPRDPEMSHSKPDLDYQKKLDFHAELRLKSVLNVFDVVADLIEQKSINPGDPVVIRGAHFQTGSGTKVDQTAAAHKLPGQIYIGADRLDTLIRDELRASHARHLFATTTELPDYVNRVDSLWEKKGLREAFRGAIASLVEQAGTADRQGSLQQAFKRFTADALAALNLAREHNESLRRDHDAEVGSDSQSIAREDQDRMAQVIEEYQRTLEQSDYEALRASISGRRI